MAPRPAGITVVPPAYYFPSPALEIETDNGFSPVAVSIAETASPTSIMSAAIGPGRTLDKLVTFLGRRLVTFLSVVSESHLGLGPNNLVGRMISSIDWSVPHCRYEVCPNYRSPTGKPPRVGLGKIPPSVKDVVELLSSPFCHACLDAHAGSLAGSKVFIAGCDKLVKELRRSNSSTRLLTAYYVCSLASFHERTRQVLVDINAMETFDFLVDELKLSLDHVLVAPSRRALFSIVESAIIPVIKEFDALEGRFDVYNHWHVPESEMASLLPHSVRSLSILVRGLQSSLHRGFPSRWSGRNCAWRRYSPG
ncbi:hypothetical protein OE88DRAFT_1039120 [Heliocybe sulcata]|uniref:Uncharacterized protein n=1 Tax=Heliocybe sulcata TaxID=5364 RepID=A0A5C3MXG2_9AGAM|nr:hypothetical protein OE88DRAFT_1039120 [Heliocybe sulcata]